MIDAQAGAFEGPTLDAMPDDPEGRLFCVLATYHRPDALRATLEATMRQSRPPDVIIVVDNGSDAVVRNLCERVGAHYYDAGGNLGPAGAFTLAIGKVLDHARVGDWLVTIGDDDPPSPENRFERLWNFAMSMSELDAKVAGVGASGARYSRRLGKFARVPDSELVGPVRVDYLAGNQLFHRCEALREVGPYDSALFFGFEEAEWGLRATSRGRSMYADGAIWREDRVRNGRIGIKRPTTPLGTSAWRRYYSVRNSTLIARDFAESRRAVMRTALRGGVGGTIALFSAGRPPRESLLPLRGALDGLKGRSGRTIIPPNADKMA